MESREKLHARLKYESREDGEWATQRAIAKRSDYTDGEAIHKFGRAAKIMDKLLDRLKVIDMSTIPVMDEDPHTGAQEVEPHKIDHMNLPLDGRGTD